MGLFGKKLPYTKHLSITPAQPVPGRSGIAIAACVRNEARYIGEWLRFHLAVGVRHFYVYDDGSTDGTADIIRDVAGSHATIMPWAGRMTDVSSRNLLNSQAIAFAHAILNFGALYERMAFIDADEFLLPKQGDTVMEALAGAKGFPNISLPWHMFGTGGHKTRPEGGVLRNYLVRARDPLSRLKNASNFKCIVDPCAVKEVSIHQFQTLEHGEMTANDEGRTFTRKGRKKPEFYSARFLQLNHYYSKSGQDLEEKLKRGPASPASRERYNERVLSAVANIEVDTVEDRAMVDFLDRTGINL